MRSKEAPTSQTLTPEQLSARIEAARPRIVLALRARLSPRLRRVVDAEDLWQETVLEAMGAVDSFRWQGEAAFVRWIMTVAARSLTRASRRHLGRDFDRPDAVSLDSLAMVIAQTSTGPATRAQRRDEADRILVALEKLPEGQRQILTLDLVHLMNHREMAELLEKKVDAVRKTHFRALQSLRKILEEDSPSS